MSEPVLDQILSRSLPPTFNVLVDGLIVGKIVRDQPTADAWLAYNSAGGSRYCLSKTEAVSWIVDQYK